MSAKNGPFTALMLTTLWTATVWAGNLDAPAAPTDSTSAMYGLDDVYNRLDAGEAGAKRTGAFTEPASGPASTGWTLDDVMGKAPAVDNTNGAVTTEVLQGKTFWGLRSDGTWGNATGALATQTINNTTTAQPAGNYAAFDLATEDTELAAGNIATGVTIYGVTGTVNVATGDAVSGDVLTGKTFSNAIASGVVGSIPVKDGDNASTAQSAAVGVNKFTAPTGFYDGDDKVTATDAQVVALDTNIVTANIKSGITIFGVAGDSNVVNTSSGDAVAGDIRTGKKAWVGGSEVTGILAPAAVERTGQTPTVPFAALTGSDGDLERGVVWPNPRFTNNSDGTVTDNLTGLVWLQNANCAAAARSWTQALADVNQLKTDGTMNSTDCGDTSNSTDWRLPNRRELESLIAIAYISPALSDAVGTGQWTADDPFSGVQPTSSYWSSSISAGNVEDAWIVHFTNGLIEPASKTDPHLVWPVRAGQ